MRSLRITALSLLFATWLLATSAGANLLLSCVAPFYFKKCNYTRVSGSIIQRNINLQNLELDWRDYQLKADKLSLDYLTRRVTGANITIDALGEQLELATLQLQSDNKFQSLNLEATGSFQGQELNLAAQAKYENYLEIQKLWLNWGNNRIRLLANKWTIDLVHPYKLKANGELSQVASLNPKITGNIQAEDFEAVINGTLAEHQIRAKLKNQTIPVELYALAAYKDSSWQSNTLELSSNEEVISGNAKFNTHTMTGELKLAGIIQGIEAKLKLELLAHEKLNGKLQLNANDLSIISYYIPELTRVKGKFDAVTNISGNIRQAILKSHGTIADITMTIPSLGIKIKPMRLSFDLANDGKLKFNGNGSMRQGPGDFSVTGQVELLTKDFKNNTTILVNNAEFINNKDAKLQADAKLGLNYNVADKQLFIKGDIAIVDGIFRLDTSTNGIVVSKDIEFINEKTSRELNITPELRLRIDEAVSIQAFGIDGNASGKLNISAVNDILYADGRITIKEGRYKLPGQELQIHKGRLLYPPGTPLTNPTLDLKLESQNDDGLKLIVQGFAAKPKIREQNIHSKEQMMSQVLTTGTGMLSDNITKGRLRMPDVGISSSNTADDGFFANPGQAKNDIGELDKELVLGIPLGTKMYLQYLQNLNESSDPTAENAVKSNNRRLKLRYFLNKNWFLGLETGELGHGADLGFTVER